MLTGYEKDNIDRLESLTDRLQKTLASELNTGGGASDGKSCPADEADLLALRWAVKQLRQPVEVPDQRSFWPQAMLPAWMLVNNEFTVEIHRNKLATRLIKDAGLFSARSRITLKARDDKDLPSLWRGLFTQDASIHTDAGMRVIEQHFEILREFEALEGVLLAPEELSRRLREVESPQRTVTPYVPGPTFCPEDCDIVDSEETPPRTFIRVGVRISPPGGLRLKTPLEESAGGRTTEYMDAVIAYRIMLQWENWEPTARITKLTLHGLQPALHDATERHKLWEEGLYYKTSSFLTHSFKSPLVNASSFAKSLSSSIVTDPPAAIRDSVELTNKLQDMIGLVNLLRFINQSAKFAIKVQRVLSDDTSRPPAFRIEDVLHCMASTVQSIVNGRLDEALSATIARRRVVALFDAAHVTQPASESLDLAPYRDLVRAITTLSGVSPTDGIYVDGLPDYVRDLLLHVMVSELIVNAVKHFQESPEIRVAVSYSDRSGLDIDVFNNGDAMPREYFDTIDERVFEQTGNKRLDLGLILNKRAATKLSIVFEWRSPPEKGTRLGIFIPAIGGDLL